jgi:NAD(P)H-hydrate epimerase
MFYDYFLINKSNFVTSLSRIILTPHSGELAFFFSKVSGDKIRASVMDDVDRLNNSLRLCNFIKGSIVVSKGNPTFVCFNNGIDNVYINITNGISLAKAGSGDVLAGMISAFVSNSFSSINSHFDDVVLEGVKNAVFLHGLAGQLAKKKYTSLSTLPTLVIDSIPEAIKFILDSYSRNVSVMNLESFSKSIIEYSRIIDIGGDT